ncbi:hypothetical protein [Xanthobacter oligotrophicus]|uniref:hypothetical protein n=1 Tax=Xanthobacter oligotrophicus TaxID=2607286 RepID=UPI001AED6A05|nr:hypothetical protein [Xanthobacter oligotrophicus]MCG5235300.1 hypothetical protein [Xanthobacter oligotrophicus]
MRTIIASIVLLLSASAAGAVCPFDPNCLNNPYGAGSPYKPDGLMNPYSDRGSPYSNNSWTNPYATNAPKLYDERGNYRGGSAPILSIRTVRATRSDATGAHLLPTASTILLAQAAHLGETSTSDPDIFRRSPAPRSQGLIRNPK